MTDLYDLGLGAGNEDKDKSKSSQNNFDEPIPFDSIEDKSEVSRSPLNLGSSGTAGNPGSSAVPKVSKPTSASPAAPESIASSADKITGVRTFVTRLHIGAIGYLDEQIREWLAKNPGVQIKKTNITTGDIQSKKTEPNLIVMVWY